MKIAQERLFIIDFVISYMISQHNDIIYDIIVFGTISFAQERLKIPSYMISYAISYDFVMISYMISYIIL